MYKYNKTTLSVTHLISFYYNGSVQLHGGEKNAIIFVDTIKYIPFTVDLASFSLIKVIFASFCYTFYQKPYQQRALSHTRAQMK